MTELKNDINSKLDNHESRIKSLEENDKKIMQDLTEIKDGLRERYARLDESNNYLRELSLKMTEQNNDILKEVLKGNQENSRRQDEINKLNTENKWKFWIGAFGSGGFIYVIFELITKALQ